MNKYFEIILSHPLVYRGHAHHTYTTTLAMSKQQALLTAFIANTFVDAKRQWDVMSTEEIIECIESRIRNSALDWDGMTQDDLEAAGKELGALREDPLDSVVCTAVEAAVSRRIEAGAREEGMEDTV